MNLGSFKRDLNVVRGHGLPLCNGCTEYVQMGAKENGGYAAVMKKKLLTSAMAIAACVAEISSAAPDEIRLMPAGEFRARDGRPHEVDAWRIDAESAARVIARADGLLGDLVIDYEHQTLNAEINGKEAPAAGWFKKLEWRDDAQGGASAAGTGTSRSGGLYAVDVQWTAKAKAMIEAGEYRYVSPVFAYDKKTGVVLAVQMAALTNDPGIDGNSDLAARAAAKFQTTTEEDTVDREKLIALLGLAKDAGDDQIEQAMTALKAKADSVDRKDTEIATLKAKAVQAYPAKFSSSEFVALKTEKGTDDVDALVKQGLDDGKLLPAQKEWAKELGTSDVAALKSYLEKTPAIAALKGGTQTKGEAPKDDGDDALSADELAVCKNLGIDPEDYKKANA